MKYCEAQFGFRSGSYFNYKNDLERNADNHNTIGVSVCMKKFEIDWKTKYLYICSTNTDINIEIYLLFINFIYWL